MTAGPNDSITRSDATGRAALRPLHPDFAAEVTGLDLGQRFDPEDLAFVRDAWTRFPVLSFPDQPLTPSQLETFTLQLGPFGIDPFVAPMPGHPNVLEVRREANETGLIFGAAWHSDWSFQECPPSATLLHAKVIPPVGGDTLYADCRGAYEALPEPRREELRGLRALHSAAAAYGAEGALTRDKSPRAMEILTSPAAEDVRAHPLVRTHPESRRDALFVNPVYTRRIESLGETESESLLRSLYAHCLQERFVYRHRWQANMLVIWDNRCTMHSALGGYEGHARTLHRTTVAGESPVLRD